MKLNIITIVPISMALFLTGCITCDKSECVQPPDPFKFTIMDKNSREDLLSSGNPSYHPDTIRLFYYQDGQAIDLPLLKTAKELHDNVFSNQLLPYVSAAENIKDYYLRLNYQDIDTLMIDVRQIDFECCTVFQYTQCYYNGHILKRSQEDYSVFLIEK